MTDASVNSPAPPLVPAVRPWRLLATSVAGLMVVVIAVQSLAYAPGDSLTPRDHGMRLIVFASLTIWLTLAIGVRRRGAAAISVLAFASFLELFVLPVRGQAFGTLASANLGIVCAYCALQVYAWRRSGQHRLGARTTA